MSEAMIDHLLRQRRGILEYNWAELAICAGKIREQFTRAPSDHALRHARQILREMDALLTAAERADASREDLEAVKAAGEGAGS